MHHGRGIEEPLCALLESLVLLQKLNEPQLFLSFSLGPCGVIIALEWFLSSIVLAGSSPSHSYLKTTAVPGLNTNSI